MTIYSPMIIQLNYGLNPIQITSFARFSAQIAPPTPLSGHWCPVMV